MIAHKSKYEYQYRVSRMKNILVLVTTHECTILELHPTVHSYIGLKHLASKVALPNTSFIPTQWKESGDLNCEVTNVSPQKLSNGQYQKLLSNLTYAAPVAISSSVAFYVIIIIFFLHCWPRQPSVNVPTRSFVSLCLSFSGPRNVLSTGIAAERFLSNIIYKCISRSDQNILNFFDISCDKVGRFSCWQ